MSGRWLDLIERITICARMLRAGSGRPTGFYQLSDAQLSVLWGIYGHSQLGARQNQLAAALAISSAHVSGLVEQLRGRGLLVGHRPGPDRRCQSWRLTESGQATLASVLADMADWACTMDRRMPPERSQTLATLLDEVVEILRDERAAGGSTTSHRLKLRHFPPDEMDSDVPSENASERLPEKRRGGAAA